MTKSILRSQLRESQIPIDCFASTIIQKDTVKKGIGKLADKIHCHLDERPITIVQIGYGSQPFSVRLMSEKPFRTRRYTPVFIRASAYEGTSPAELQHDADVIDWSPYEGTQILVDEVRHTGQTLAVMKDYFSRRFQDEKIWTTCLIDRVDCVHERFHEPIDFCGFHIESRGKDRQSNPQGWLVGFGMDIDDYYRGEKSIWWTMVFPHANQDQDSDIFRKPKTKQLPILAEVFDLVSVR